MLQRKSGPWGFLDVGMREESPGEASGPEAPMGLCRQADSGYRSAHLSARAQSSSLTTASLRGLSRKREKDFISGCEHLNRVGMNSAPHLICT